ncbi:FAD-dependent monooxygenase [Rickettsiales endosymbiont of Stachyamoeba lipophora]|uniref:FAD-dependent monooxygenase n=1 Tax=Rickettsiales endosymbiont of Stachyamoeba lipophora TaxID=2486578 RepID=UPI0013DE3166|nr:FAD-dependent monooxygenase [Rickettsiales endosymbiont of Stachyamoeba lipophora]
MNKFDVIIIGNGPSGGALAAALANMDLKIALIDIKPLIGGETQVKPDPRTSAIANYSAKILDNLGLWQDLGEKSGLIEQIRITDNDSPLFLHFDNILINHQVMGYIVYNQDMLSIFHQKILNSNNITFFNHAVVSVSSDAYKATVTLDDGRIISAALAIAADGRMSKVRELYNFEIRQKDYGHSAMIGYVTHEKPHNNIALEKFYSSSGPFAVLPLKDQHTSNFVWTETHLSSTAILKLTPEKQAELLNDKFGYHWGKVTLASKLYSYPLSLVHVNRYFQDRVLLFGDAAHGIHPIAGQGYNLSLRDLEILVAKISEQLSIGGDLGSYQMLESYELARKTDDTNMIMITDLLNALFLSDNPLVKLSRQVGLKLINTISPLKQFFMNYAMGKRND